MSDKLIDFNAKREKNIESKRRQFERVLFEDFLGAYCVVDDIGTGYPIKMVDISWTGCMFQIPWSQGQDENFKTGNELRFKIYFSKYTYLPVVVTLKHSTEFRDQNGQRCLRYGAEFDQTLPSFQALKSFIAFIYQYAEFGVLDKGEGKVYFL